MHSGHDFIKVQNKIHAIGDMHQIGLISGLSGTALLTRDKLCQTFER